MRTSVLAVLIGLLLLPAASAQDGMTFTEEHQVRIAYGDIPSTEDTEAAGQWNVEHRILASKAEELVIAKVTGHTGDQITCTCDFSLTEEEAQWRVTFIGNTTGEATVTYTHHRIGGSSHGDSLSLPAGALVLVYTPDWVTVQASSQNELGPNFYFPGADPAMVIHQYHAEGAFWFTASPGTAAVAPAPAEGGFGFLELILGLLVGAGVWFLLVKQGLVQKRQRKQVAGEAVHKTVAKTEPKSILEGRKRVLMAALKELEVAKMNKEMATEDYDALKADFKKQTVTVMRALEESA